MIIGLVYYYKRQHETGSLSTQLTHTIYDFIFFYATIRILNSFTTEYPHYELYNCNKYTTILHPHDIKFYYLPQHIPM